MTTVNEYHAARINAAVDYIEAHLDERLDLKTLAHLARISPYHFHHLFTAAMGEPPYAFINRLRLERAAAGLLLSRGSTITDIALACGFNDSATFARAFKKRFRHNARGWKNAPKSKIDQDARAETFYIIRHALEINAAKLTPNRIEVEYMQASRLRYVRHTGNYTGDMELFHGLYRRLAELEPQACQPHSDVLVIYHDPFGITPAERLKLSLAVETRHPGRDCMAIPAGAYLVCSYAPLAPAEHIPAWVAAYREALRRGLKPSLRPCFERYYRHAGAVTGFDICIAVESPRLIREEREQRL